MRMSKMFAAVATLGVGLTLTGCVSQSQFKRVQAERDALRQEVQTVRSEAEQYKEQLGAVISESSAKDETITSLSTANSELQAQLEEINRQYAEALPEQGRYLAAPALATPAGTAYVPPPIADTRLRIALGVAAAVALVWIVASRRRPQKPSNVFYV